RGDTALHIAARCGYSWFIAALLDEIENLERRQQRMFRGLFREYNIDLSSSQNSSFHDLAAGNSLERKRFLDQKNKRQQTALHLAVRKKHCEVACLLIRHGADTG